MSVLDQILFPQAASTPPYTNEQQQHVPTDELVPDELELLLDDDDPQQGQFLITTISPGFGISSILLPAHT